MANELRNPPSPLGRPVVPPTTAPGQGTVTVVEPPIIARPFPKRMARWRLLLAFAIAGGSDLLSSVLAFAPPLEWGLDFTTAFALFIVLGWQWMLLPGLIFEAIPALAVFPFWVMVVAGISVWGTVRPQGKDPGPSPSIKRATPAPEPPLNRPG